MADDKDMIDFSRRSVPSDTHHHSPYAAVFNADWRTRQGESALLLLNQPVENFGIFKTLWHGCSYKIYADGGANRLYEVFGADAEGERKSFLPNIIHGDLDSLRPSVREYYANLGVSISLDSDQYSTDFGKSLKKIQEHFADHPSSSSDGKTLNVMILGSIGGRVDQGIGLLSEIMREQKSSLESVSSTDLRGHDKKALEMKLYLVSPSNLTFLLPPGKNIISFPSGTVQKSPYSQNGSSSPPVFTANVGILPLFGPAHITTVGLEYDVADWPTQMGGQVSTSNHILNCEVRIFTEEYLIFTVEFNLEAFEGQ